ncbi:hypothetical protein ACU686_11910 [Yinghuangia aomiensis]
MTYQAQGRAWIQVTHHHFGLTRDGFWPTRTVGRAWNGLVTAADGVVVVSTGIHTGGVRVEAQAWPHPPAVDASSWEDIGETSVDVPSGHLLMTSIDGSGLDAFPDLTPAARALSRAGAREGPHAPLRRFSAPLLGGASDPGVAAAPCPTPCSRSMWRTPGRPAGPAAPSPPSTRHAHRLPTTAPPGPQTQRAAARPATTLDRFRGRPPTLRPRAGRLPEHQLLLAGTDWKALGTPYGDGGFLPEALGRILDPDPAVRAAAVRVVIDGVTHQNTIYEATVPVARFVAAVLNHPATATGEDDPGTGTPKHRPTRVVLLDWLGATAFDADDARVARGERHWDGAYLAGLPGHARVPGPASGVLPRRSAAPRRPRRGRPRSRRHRRHPLTEHPGLADRRAGLADHVRRVLATSTDRYSRDRALDALKAWGHDTGPLETPDDVAARERYARLKAEREDFTGGYTDDPPF